MKNLIGALFIIAACFILPVSCDNDSNYSLVPDPIVSEDTTYNFAYEDSILFSTTRVLQTTNVQIGSINGTGIRTLCDSLTSYKASWSPNKRKIIFIGTQRYGNYKDWGLYQIELKNYKISRLIPQEKLVITAAYSPDLKYIAYAVYDESLRTKIKLYNNKNGDIVELTDGISHTSILSWGPDSKRILVDDGYCINIEDHSITRLFSDGPFQIHLPNWSPDGLKVAFSSLKNSQPNIRIYDIVTGEFRILFRQDSLLQYNSSWSRDSKQIIFDQRPSQDSNSYLCKIDVDGNNFVKLTDGAENNWGASWSK